MSRQCTFLWVSDSDWDKMAEAVQHNWAQPMHICGICEEGGRGFKVYWPTVLSRQAHEICRDEMKDVVKEAFLSILWKWDRAEKERIGESKYGEAQITVTNAVRNKMGMSLLKARDKFGERYLRCIFKRKAQSFVSKWERKLQEQEEEKERLKMEERRQKMEEEIIEKIKSRMLREGIKLPEVDDKKCIN